MKSEFAQEKQVKNQTNKILKLGDNNYDINMEVIKTNNKCFLQIKGYKT